MMQRTSRHLDRCGTMTREKRGLDPADGEAIHPEPKRHKVPALASVIVEALKVDSLQKLCSSLEPVLRRVVSEEVERALAKLGPARPVGRSSPKRLEGPDGRDLQLQFRSRLSQPLFTGGKVEGEQGAAIHVVLLDANSGHVITSGPESSAKLDIVVLEGDFNHEDDEDWTEEEFESHIVKEREGKRPLLTGDLQISLKEGVGTLGELTFTDNSSWIRSRKFRLGLKIVSGFCDGIRVREAKTEAFMVKDHRGELYKKHFPPALKDEVWRLEKIGKDGSFHKRLNKTGIYTVEDFLRVVVRDPQRLRKILGSSMSNKMWEVLVEHAKTCVLSGKHYVYYSDNTRSVGAIFNNIYEFTGLIAGGQYYSAESLDESQKVFTDSLVKRAYEDWMHAIEYDGKALLNFKASKKATASRKEPTSGPANYAASYDQQVAGQQPSITSSIEQPTVDSGLVRGVSADHNGNQVMKYSNPQHSTSNGHTELQITSLAPQNRLVGVPHQQASLEFHPLTEPVQPLNYNSCDDWSRQRYDKAVDDYFTEEEIRIRSHEILENEDMQHLLRVFSMGGASVVPQDGFGFSSYVPSPSPNFNFNEHRGRSAGRACAGWLKIKAAMRWGIFIRKKAAERRAQLVEIED